MVLEKIELTGIPASPGIVIGKAFLVNKGKLKRPRYKISSEAVPEEVSKFYHSINSVIENLSKIKEKLLKQKNDIYNEELLILDMQILLLNDSMVAKKTVEIIKDKKINAEWALEIALDDVFKKFEDIKDEYIAERKDDIKQVFEKVFYFLMGKKYSRIEEIKKPVILIGHDFSPADTIQMNFSKIKGFVTEVGSKTSHTSIIARSMEIPAVVGVKNITDIVNGGDDLIVDGFHGLVIVNPDEETLKIYNKKKKNYSVFIEKLYSRQELPAITKDGVKIDIFGNIEMPAEVDSVLEHGGEGIGLYRTEYLYLSKDSLPSEEEHLEAYKNVAEKMYPRPVIIRTIDIGADKLTKSFETDYHLNPAMGLRAIRFCFKNPEIFKTQLRGILKASIHDNVKILFPMVSGFLEIEKIKNILESVKKELKKENIKFNQNIDIGIMIEIPSSAILADIFSSEVNFFSIGTNDLIQYSLAIDRMNDDVSYLYEPAHPAIVRIIKMTVEGAKISGIPVDVCGEMAGEALYVPILLGLGITKLSMNPVSIPYIKELIRNLSISECVEIIEKILKMKKSTAIKEYLYDTISKKIKNFDLFI